MTALSSRNSAVRVSPAVREHPRIRALAALLRSAVVGSALVLAVSATAGETPAATRANLQLAYAADVNAQARYAAFAEVAEREGYLQVAKLFRAAVRSEKVRAGVHADVLRRLGDKPVARVESVQTKGTRQNILATLGNEGVEHLTVYPRFAQQARRDQVPEAVLGFTLSHGAEENLLRLYSEAIGRLESMRSAGEAFHVCRTCGHVVKGPAPDVCPVSLSAAEAFERVE